MVAIKVNGHPYNLPTQWSEINVATYREMERHAFELNSVRLFSILTGIDYDMLINFDCSQFDEKVLQHLSFVHDVPEWDKLPKPEHLVIDGVEYKVPESIESTTWFQRTMLKTLAVNGVQEKLQMIELVAPCLTYMMQPVIEGKVSDKNYKELQKKMDQLPIEQAYPVATFFLSTYLHYSRESKST